MHAAAFLVESCTAGRTENRKNLVGVGPFTVKSGSKVQMAIMLTLWEDDLPPHRLQLCAVLPNGDRKPPMCDQALSVRGAVREGAQAWWFCELTVTLPPGAYRVEVAVDGKGLYQAPLRVVPAG